MNAKRRKNLEAIVGHLRAFQAVKEKIENALNMVMEDEQEAFGNMPESLQEAERGQAMYENIEDMQFVIDELEAIDIEDLASRLEDICDR